MLKLLAALFMLIDHTGSVSYTHLDVYKRQVSLSATSDTTSSSVEASISSLPVSDVFATFLTSTSSSEAFSSAVSSFAFVFFVEVRRFAGFFSSAGSSFAFSFFVSVLRGLPRRLGGASSALASSFSSFASSFASGDVSETFSRCV